jgi:hypothetical protein
MKNIKIYEHTSLGLPTVCAEPQAAQKRRNVPIHGGIADARKHGYPGNLQTGSITPQLHIVGEDCFETVHSDGSNLPPNWEELIVFSSFQANIDEEGTIPELADEWLSPEELNHVSLPKGEEAE